MLVEALRRGGDVVGGAETLLAGYRQWLFANLFEGDPKTGLDRDPDSAVWRSLAKAADGATLTLTLSNTLNVAAFDKRLSDGAWNGLAFSLKVTLLPLRTPKLLRSAARHVLASTLSVRKARIYVDSLLRPDGKQTRLSPTRARTALNRFSSQLNSPNYTEKLAGSINKLSRSDRVKARGKILELT